MRYLVVLMVLLVLLAGCTPAKCKEKVLPLGDTCKTLFYGYEYSDGKCAMKGVNGCGYKTPFESLEECQKVCEK